MKKNYVTPSLETIEILGKDAIMNVISNETVGAGTGEGSSNDQDPDLSRKLGGSWSNVWGDKW